MTKKDPILHQLKRVSGQLNGLVKMYESGRTCAEIAQQIAAVRSSLGRVARDLLTNEAAICSQEKKLDDLDIILKEMFRY